jgi:two-component system sensor histidine kinase RpfC
MTPIILRYQSNWVRVVIAFVFLLVIPWFGSDPLSFSISDPLSATAIGYILFTVALILLDSREIITKVQHNCLTLFADISGITLLLIIGESAASPLCTAYYLFVIHNGINTNTRQLLISSFLAASGFTTVLYLSSYWNSHLELGVGLISGLTVISLILFREIANSSNYNQIIKAEPVNPKFKGEHSSLNVLFITNDTQDRHMLLSYIDSWGITIETSNSSLRAFAELANSADSENRFTTVIVDALNLDMDPVQLAKYIKLDDALSKIHLIHISPEYTTDHETRLMEAGYSTLLKTPIDKTILFDALHTHNEQTANGKNITRLIKHYSSKTNLIQPLDILLAIGNREEQEHFRNTLEQNGQRAYTANSGTETLDALQTHRFDLIILDFKMPDIEGKEIIKLYYYTYLNEDWVPFIALVDEANPEILSACREAEVNAILVRPVEIKELLITVADIASSKSKQTESIDKHWLPPHISNIQIKDSNDQILNTKTLLQLEELSSSNNFLSQLTSNFNQDMDILIDGLEQSIRSNCFTDFKDLIYALKDSSCNLGADALHKLSLLGLQINQREFQGQATIIVEELRDTMIQTKLALQNYVNKNDSSTSKSE